MKQFKTIDLWINIILIVISIIAIIPSHKSGYGIIGYFVVGGWQVISMLIHTISGWFTNKGSKRMVYQLSVLIIGAILLIGIPFNWAIIVLFFLLIAAPFMAIYYTYICYDELRNKMHRPLDELK